MTEYDWQHCPEPQRAQLHQLIHGFQATLAEQLHGIYLHGSLALGCFNPHRSDLDLLIVVGSNLIPNQQRALAELLLNLSGNPSLIELSCITIAALREWRHPAPYAWHYSEAWRTRYQHDLASDAWQRWPQPAGHDPDLAGHITVVRQRGVVLHGPPITAIVPAIPQRDSLDSFGSDVLASLASLGDDPIYGVLNACRTAAFLRDNCVRSKAEGGAWALRTLPAEHHAVIEAALAGYRSQPCAFDSEQLAAFAAWMRAELAPHLPLR
jgi:hypothetical protein